MRINKKLIMAKARGFTISIEKMNDKDRLRQPSTHYGDDYNRLLSATLEIFPVLEPLIPPEIEFYEHNSGDRSTLASFSEIDTYCEQIFQLAAECDE